MLSFKNAVISELLKLKSSGILWLSILGTLSTNIVLLLVALFLPQFSTGIEFNPTVSWQNWISFHYYGMLPMMLPMYLVILCALSILMENQNNGWKLLYGLPLHKSVIYLSKLKAVFIVFLFSHLLFVILLSLIPFLVGIDISDQAIPLNLIFWLILTTIISSTGILSIVYLVSYYSKSFVFPLAVGIVGFVLAQLLKDYGLEVVIFPFSLPTISVESILNGKYNISESMISSLCWSAGTTILGGWLANKDIKKI